MKKLTTEEVIKRFIEKNGNKYDYSKVNYINARTKVCIICPEHGEFWQKVEDHFRGVGCPECNKKRLKNGARRFTKEEFIQKAKEIHNDKYDYSKIKYKDCRTKICIICPEHGEFWQTPLSHLHTRGCPKCSKRYMDTEYFIEKAKELYGDKYDYSKVEYVNNHTKVCIICPEHGEFYVNTKDFLNGHGRPECGLKSRSDKIKGNTITFIEKARKIHGNKYDYSKVDYKRGNEKVCIICPEHGEFWQRPTGHLQGYGCPCCNESHIEREVNKLLLERNVKFERYKRFNWLGLQSLDFYLPEYNIAIECQGIQHFEEVQYFGGEKGLKENKKRDKKKYDLCKEHGVVIFYVNYKENVSEKIKELFINNAVQL